MEKTLNSVEEKVKERTAELEKTYKSLKESEESLAEAQRMAYLGSWNWDIITNRFYLSDGIYRIFGRTPQEFGATYNAFLNCVHPEDREYVNKAIIEALNGRPYNIDHRIILANEEERVVHEQGEVVFDEKNIPIRMKGTIQDITERKKAEEKIKSLANIVESSNDAIITESLDGIITSWNKEAEKVYGYQAKEILGKHLSILEPDNLKGEIKQFSEKIKKGERIQHYETLRLKKDCTIINVSITVSPVFDSTGKLVAISTIARDITERKKAEEALQEAYENLQVQSEELQVQSEEIQAQNEELQTQSEELQVQNEELQAQSEEFYEAYDLLRETEERFRTLTENSPDMIARFDRQNYCIYTNPAAIRFYDIPAIAKFYGLSVDELSSKTNFKVQIDPEMVTLSEKQLANIFATGKPETMEFQ